MAWLRPVDFVVQAQRAPRASGLARALLPRLPELLPPERLA